MDTTTEAGINSVRLTPPEVDHAWHLILPMLETVIAQVNGEYSAEDIYLRALEGSMAIWVVYEGGKIWAVAAAELAVYPKARGYRVLALAGKDFSRWKHLEAMLEEHARELKCDFIEALCRPGMAQKLYPEGYSTQCVVLRKPVNRRTH